MSDGIGWMGYPIPLWHQEHRSRAMLIMCLLTFCLEIAPTLSVRKLLHSPEQLLWDLLHTVIRFNSTFALVSVPQHVQAQCFPRPKTCLLKLSQGGNMRPRGVLTFPEWHLPSLWHLCNPIVWPDFLSWESCNYILMLQLPGKAAHCCGQGWVPPLL